MHSSGLTHLILDLIILIELGEENKLWIFLLCNFLKTAVTSYFLGPNILLSIVAMLEILNLEMLHFIKNSAKYGNISWQLHCFMFYHLQNQGNEGEHAGQVFWTVI